MSVFSFFNQHIQHVIKQESILNYKRANFIFKQQHKCTFSLIFSTAASSKQVVWSLILLMEGKEQSSIQSILQKNYEERTPIEHNTITTLLFTSLGKYSMEQCKWLSLLCKYFPNQQSFTFQAFQPQSIVIFPNTNQQFSTVILNKPSDIAELTCQGFLILVAKRHQTNCLSLAEETIEQIIKILHAFEYLSQLPRRRLYHFLRNIDVLHFSFNQVVYLENQIISSQPYVYLVRRGEFTFMKRQKSTHKNVQLYTFFEGYLFGTEEEVASNDHIPKMKEKRMFTVRCKSSEAVVYRIKLDFFNSFLRKSCEHLLRNNSLKLNRFFQQRFLQAEINLTRNAQFITQPFKRSASVQMNYEIMPSIKKSGSTQKHTLVEQIKKQSLPPLNIKAESTSRKKLLSKEQLVKLIPEYQEQKLILLKQYKCHKVRECIKDVAAPCKSQVLLGLMKTTYTFDKLKNRKNLP